MRNNEQFLILIIKQLSCQIIMQSSQTTKSSQTTNRIQKGKKTLDDNKSNTQSLINSKLSKAQETRLKHSKQNSVKQKNLNNNQCPKVDYVYKKTRNLKQSLYDNKKPSPIIVYSQESEQGQRSRDLNKQFLSQQSQRLTNAKLQKQNISLRRQVEVLKYEIQELMHVNQTLKGEIQTTEQAYVVLQDRFISLKQQHKQHQRSMLQQIQSQTAKQKQMNLKFILESQQQIMRLKELVNQLNQQKERFQFGQMPSQRQEIKDRIIMKLQDQLITTKLMLQQKKATFKRTTYQQYPHEVGQNPSKRKNYNDHLGSRIRY